MKCFVFVLLVVVLAAQCSRADDEDCSLLNGNLLMKPNEVFEFGEACLRFRCVGKDQFKVTMGCEIRWRGAPDEAYKKEIKQLAEDVKNGAACRNAYGV